MDALSKRVLDYPKCEGAILSGIATRETLALVDPLPQISATSCPGLGPPSYSHFPWTNR